MMRQVALIAPTVVVAALAVALVTSGQANSDETTVGSIVTAAARPPVAAPPATVAQLVAQASPPAASAPGGPILEVREFKDGYRAILVDKAQVKDPHDLVAIARPVCDGLTACSIAVWYDRANMPDKLPVTPPQLAEEEFSFGRVYDGTEDSLWNCNKYPQFEDQGAVCLPRDMQ